ncbi:MAG: hypothetical protein AB1476_02735 [Candidatus Hadarchaeota archaeon]
MITALSAIVATIVIGYPLSTVYLSMFVVPFATIFGLLGYRWGKLRFAVRKNDVEKNILKKPLARLFLFGILASVTSLFLLDLFFFGDFLSYFITAANMGNPASLGGILLLFLVMAEFITILIFSVKLKPTPKIPLKIINRAQNWHTVIILTTYFILAALVFVLNPVYWPLFFVAGVFILTSVLIDTKINT